MIWNIKEKYFKYEVFVVSYSNVCLSSMQPDTQNNACVVLDIERCEDIYNRIHMLIATIVSLDIKYPLIINMEII